MKKINGTWFEFQHHHTIEGMYWNEICRAFSCADWARKIEEIAELDMEYIVLQNVSRVSPEMQESYYPDAMFPVPDDFFCKDAVETLLATADRLDLKVFMPIGYFANWLTPDITMKSPDLFQKAKPEITKLYRRYGHHSSFYGWYFPDETALTRDGFPDFFMHYLEVVGTFLRKLDASKRLLAAPYGTNQINPNDHFIKQLETLDMDFIAYQDEVGVLKTAVEDTKGIFEDLAKAHEKAGRAKLWADIELFEFADEVYKSPLLPAPFERIKQQIENVAPYVEEILCYQVFGLMNAPNSPVFCGHPDSERLYREYENNYRTL